jgi:hypothetical protein
MSNLNVRLRKSFIAVASLFVGSFVFGVSFYTFVRLAWPEALAPFVTPSWAPLLWLVIAPFGASIVCWRHAPSLGDWRLLLAPLAVGLAFLGMGVGFVLLCAMDLACK